MVTVSRDGSIVIGLIVACAAFWLFALFPGELTPDSVTQLQQGQSGVYSNAHPAAQSWLLGQSMALIGSAGLVIVGPILLAMLGLVGLVPTLPDSRRAHVVFALLATFPPLWGALGTVSKDGWTTALLLDAIALIAARRPLPAVLVIAAMSAFRHNAVVLVPALALYVLWDHRDRKPFAAFAAAAMLAGALVTPRLIDKALHVREGRPAAPSLVFDVTGVYVQRPDAFNTSPFAKQAKLVDVQAAYDPRSARKYTSDRHGLSAFRHRQFLGLTRYKALTTEWKRVVTTWPGAG
jgi:hypothetical protein